MRPAATSRKSGSRAAGAAALALPWLVAAAAMAASPPGPCASVPEPVWTQLEYSASKLLLSATATTTLTFQPGTTVSGTLATPPAPERPVPVSPCVAILTMTTDVPFGRDESATTWLDPGTGAVQQIDKTAVGRGSFHKTLRFLDSGIFVWRSAPADRDEEDLPAARWTKRKQYKVASGAELPRDRALTDSYALLFLLSTSHLDRPGAARSFIVFADDRPAVVEMAAGSLTQRRIDVLERWPGGQRRRRGTALVREVHVAGRALGAEAGASSDIDLGLLGLRGDLTVFVEVGTQLPLALAGRAEAIGRLTVRLDTVDLCAAPPGS